MLTLLISSFLFGGALVALFSFLAEKADKKLAGMILSFPSTLIVSLYFLWQVLEPAAYKQAAVTMYLSLALSLLVVYIFIKVLELSSRTSFALIASMIFWAGTAYLVLISDLQDAWVAMIIYILIVTVVHKLYASQQQCEAELPAITYTPQQKIMRLVLAGSVISIGVYFAQTLGPIWGGIFTMFPAAYLAALLAYSQHYDHKFLYKAFSNSALGSVSLVIYIIASLWAFPLWGELWGSLAAIIASAAYVLAFHVLQTKSEQAHGKPRN